MIHPHTEIRFINEIVGYGVVATRFIPKGTITWVLDKLDRFFTEKQIRSLDSLYQDVLFKFTYRNAEGNYILCWDNARFVNHSSISNCITSAYEFEFAVRDIHPGEELTDDYGYLNIESPFEVRCETGTGRKVIYPDDFVRFHFDWDAKLLDAFGNFQKVEQPLLVLLGEPLADKIQRISSGKEKMDSILHCYYERQSLIHKAKRILKKRHTNVFYPF
jgi:uncharacterized protein